MSSTSSPCRPTATAGRESRVVKDLDLEVTGRDVIVVLDIVDTGLTLSYVLRLICASRRSFHSYLCPARPSEPQALARGSSLRGPGHR